MLPDQLRSEYRLYKPGEEWEYYLESIGEYSSVDNEFLSQICYEHYDRFNSYFPKFDLTRSRISRIKLTTKEVYDLIKYDGNTELDFWYAHIDGEHWKGKLSFYQVLSSIVETGTWFLPPVIIRHELAETLGDRLYGQPIHLIEGTHRVSYLRRWYELGNVPATNKHEFIILE
ncbi:hypothetical protein GCM10009122_26730 [Fulvivirga kasyanovii]